MFGFTFKNGFKRLFLLTLAADVVGSSAPRAERMLRCEHCKKTFLSVLSFPYVCPEPGLVKSDLFHTKAG